MTRDAQGRTPTKSAGSSRTSGGLPAPGPEPERSSGALWLVGGAVLAIAAIVIGVVVFTGGDDEEPAATEPGMSQFQPVDVSGSLDPMEPISDDGGGAEAPVATVRSFDGTEMTLPVPGKPTMIAFGAHWCPHCQATFPVIVEWLDAGGAEGVEVVAVATGTRADAPNYPPSAWLEEIEWPGATVADDEDSTLAQAYGLTSYPYLVFVDADGTVQHRIRGEVGADQLDEGVATIAP